MRIAVVNLGCKVNKVESDTIALSYLRRGAQLTDVRAADVVVVNTCTVTGEAEKKTRKAVRRALRENEHAQVLVTGCAAVIDPEFFRTLGDRVSVVGKAELMEPHGDGMPPSQDDFERVGGAFPSRVAVKVQDGCNHSCAYCIVHVARGRAWSRPADEVVEEAVRLAGAGAREIVLSGIDLGSYSFVQDGARITLGGLSARLLEALDAAGHNDTRLRISSVEPRSLDEEFVSLLAQSEGRICRHLHLPLQSGSTRVLAQMRRPYTAEAYMRLVEGLRAQVPGLSLTTDIIVGFPGETEADFASTLEAASRAQFSKIHVFRYSPRAGTPAAARDDQVDSQVKDERAARLSRLADELRLRFARGQLARRACIVCEEGGLGMTESYYRVRLPQDVRPGSVMWATLAHVDEKGVFSL